MVLVNGRQPNIVHSSRISLVLNNPRIPRLYIPRSQVMFHDFPIRLRTIGREVHGDSAGTEAQKLLILTEIVHQS